MGTLVSGGILLGVLIFFHELGHFLVAKACGVRVLVFSLGFGPRVIGVRVGETDYRISLLPLGGYVRMFGDDLRQEIPDAQKRYSFLHQSVPRKSAIAAAGPVANFILPVIVLFAFGIGPETVSDAVVGTVLPDQPAARAGLRPGDRIVSIDGQPIAVFADLQEIIGDSPGRPLSVVVDRGGQRLTLSLVPRAVKGTSPLDPDGEVGRVGIMPATATAAVHVLPGSPAAAAGLSTRDRVVAVNGVKVDDGPALLAALDALAGAEGDTPAPFVLEVLAHQDGGPSEKKTVTIPPDAFAPKPVPAIARFAVTAADLDGPPGRHLAQTRNALAAVGKDLARRRGISLFDGTVRDVVDNSAAMGIGLKSGEKIAVVDGVPIVHAGEIESRLSEAPHAVHSVGVLSPRGLLVAAFRMGGRPERGLEEMKMFGAALGSAYDVGPTVERTVGPAEALRRAVKSTGALIADTARGLWMLVSLQVSFKSLGGPITIFSLAGKAMDLGVDRFVHLLCFISVNLGLLNLLPIPVLDGGHLLMFGIEAVRRREISIKTRERAVQVGFTALLLLMVAAIFNDVMRFL